MKGFKPTGFGPKAGFVFSAKQGFTGSTGAYTNVQPYVRRKAFANGGFVRQDTPRMTESSPGDSGSALVRRAKSYCALDQESGGKTPLRPGYKKGGMAKKKMPMKKDPNPMMKADGGTVSMSALSQVGRMRKRAKPPASASMVKEKFAADGGMVRGSSSDKKYVPSAVRGSSSKGLWASMKDIPALVNQIPTLAKDAAQGAMRRTQQDVADSKRRRIDSIADGTNTASNYARGGKTKRGLMTKC